MRILATISRFSFGITLFLMTMLPCSAPRSWMGHRSFGSEPEHAHEPAAPPSDCLPIDPPPPVVKIKVRVPACADPGQLIEYRVCVENCSTAEAHHVIVKDALPANAKFVKADPEPVRAGSELLWNLGTVGGGACREIILFLQATNTEDVKNCLRVQFEHGQCVVTRQSKFPPFPSPDHSQPGLPPIVTDPSKPLGKPPVVTPVPEAVKPEDLPVLDLAIRGPKTQYLNMPATYEISLTNKGKTKATNTQVHCRLPDTLKFVKASDPGVAVENVVAWNLGTLDPGAKRVMELTLRTTEKGEQCFKTTAEADLGVKKEVTFCTQFIGVSAMAIEMKDRVDPIFLGHKTSYPIAIRTQATAPLTNVRVKALIPDNLKLERANAKFTTLAPAAEGQWIEFEPLPKIEVGDQARYEIFVEAIKAGATRMHFEVSADQLDIGRPVIVEELTTIVDDRERLKAQELSRQKNTDPQQHETAVQAD